MSHNDASPPSNAPPAPPYNAPTPHDFILLSVALQGIAKVLLDHGSTSQGNTPTTEPSRQSTLLKQIVHILLNGQHEQHCCNLHEYVDAIYAEISVITDLLSHFNQRTTISVLDHHALRKNLSRPLRKLEELSVQLKPFNLLHSTTSPRQ